WITPSAYSTATASRPACPNRNGKCATRCKADCAASRGGPMSAMTPNRPYLIRAVYEWICDNGLTTHLLVDAEYPGVQVPREFINNGQIVLNVAPAAVQQFVAGNDLISFSARFSGRPMRIEVPVNAVLALFAR